MDIKKEVGKKNPNIARDETYHCETLCDDETEITVLPISTD